MYNKFNCLYPEENIGVLANISQTSLMSISEHSFLSSIRDICARIGSFDTLDDFWNYVINNIKLTDFEMTRCLNAVESLLSNSNDINIRNFTLKDLSFFSYNVYSVHDFHYYDTQNFCSNFSSKQEQIPLYPIATRHIIDSNSIIVERSPFKVSGKFKTSNSYTSGRTINYDIWVPWTLTLLNRSNNQVFIFFSAHNADSPEAKYVPSVLPNVYNGGSICFNSSLAGLDLSSDDDFRKYFFKVINEYYSGGWNTDLNSTVLSYCPSNIHHERYSEIDDPFRNFVSPEYSYFKNNYTPSRFEQLLKKATRFHSSHSTAAQYRYLFEILSNYDLKSTLSFYDDLINFSGFPSRTYDEVIDYFNSSVSSSESLGSTFAQISNYASRNTVFKDSYNSNIPTVSIFYKNTLYPSVKYIYENNLFKQVPSYIPSSSFDYTFVSDAAQKIYVLLFMKFYKNDYKKISDLYFTYDYKTSTLIEYSTEQEYNNEVSSYLVSNLKELSYAT